MSDPVVRLADPARDTADIAEIYRPGTTLCVCPGIGLG
jgi:hypothetical protein